jgi:large conductance mechanosensitive channel
MRNRSVWLTLRSSTKGRCSVKSLVSEFKEFINRGNLVDLAIAVLLATAFAPIVVAIVDGVIMNLIAAFFGQPDFSSIRLKIRGDDPDATYLEFGAVITATVQFLVVGLVCFFIVKGFNTMKRPVPVDEEGAAPTEVELLTEIRDELRRR